MSDQDKAQEFFRLFGKFEHGLKRCGFLRPDRKNAEADWRAFAQALGTEFFDHIVELQIANILIFEPPARLLREGLEWEKPQRPLNGVIQLFEQGVCRVRNSYFHGEKFVGGEGQRVRDRKLIEEALNVLEAARRRHPEIAKYLD